LSLFNCLAITDNLAMLWSVILFCERHPELFQELETLFIRFGGRNERDVHTADLVHFVDRDLGEDDLFLNPQRVVTTAIESPGAYTAEVTHARQCYVDETIEKLEHPVAAQRHADPDRHILPQLEV